MPSIIIILEQTKYTTQDRSGRRDNSDEVLVNTQHKEHQPTVHKPPVIIWLLYVVLPRDQQCKHDILLKYIVNKIYSR